MSDRNYPFIPAGGLWKNSQKAEQCYACHHEISAGEVYFAYGADTQLPGIPPGGTPYHFECALYVFLDAPKPPALFGYSATREELATGLPEPLLEVEGKWKTARRAYVCRDCAGLIRAGERYYAYTSEGGLYAPERPYHRRCAVRLWLHTDTEPQSSAEVKNGKIRGAG